MDNRINDCLDVLIRKQREYSRVAARTAYKVHHNSVIPDAQRCLDHDAGIQEGILLAVKVLLKYYPEELRVTLNRYKEEGDLQEQNHVEV